MSRNYIHEILFINWYKASPISIDQMPPKGLANAKSLITTKTWATWTLWIHSNMGTHLEKLWEAVG
jgi:hypothetical protein